MKLQTWIRRVPIVVLIASSFASFGALGQAPPAARPAEPGQPGRPPVRQVIKDTPEAQKEFDEVYEYVQIDFTKNYRNIREKVMAFVQKYKDTSLAFALFGELRFNEWQYANNRGMPDEVFVLAGKAIETNPENAEGYILRTKAALNHGGSMNYYRDAKKAIELAPQKPAAMYVWARTQQAFENYDDADEWYRRTIAAIDNPRRKANINWWLAGSLVDRGRARKDIIANIPKAEAAYRESVRLDGGPGSTYKTYDLMRFIIHFKKDVTEAVTLNNLRDKDYRLSYSGNLLPYILWSQRYLAGKASKNELAEIEKQVGISPDEAFVRGAKHIGRGDLVRAMLKAKAISNIDTLGDSGEDSCGCAPALIHAARQEDFELVKLLVDNGANVNGEDYAKTTPLSIAAVDSNAEMVEYLLKKGARANGTHLRGTPLIYAMLERGKGKDVPRIVQLLITAGVDPNLKYNGDPIINAAVRSGRADAILTLVSNGANPNARSVRSDGYPYVPLQQAAMLRNPDVIAALLSAGAEPDATESLKAMLAEIRKGGDIPGEDPDTRIRRMKSKNVLDAWYQSKAAQ